MTPILLEAPAVEPVTLAAAKTWLRLDGTDEDDLVTMLIGAARSLVESVTGKRLVIQRWRLALDAWPASGRVRFPLGPVRSVEQVRVTDAAGGASVLPAVGYVVDLASDPARLVLLDVPRSPGRPVGGVEIDFTAGYGASGAAAPAPLRHAILLLAARWYEARGDVSTTSGNAPPELSPLLGPYLPGRL